MRKIVDVRCKTCDTVSEEYGYLTDSFRCGACGEEAVRIISPIRCSLDGTSGDFPGASIKWAREHEKAAHNQGGSF